MGSRKIGYVGSQLRLNQYLVDKLTTDTLVIEDKEGNIDGDSLYAKYVYVRDSIPFNPPLLSKIKKGIYKGIYKGSLFVDSIL